MRPGLMVCDHGVDLTMTYDMAMDAEKKQMVITAKQNVCPACVKRAAGLTRPGDTNPPVQWPR